MAADFLKVIYILDANVFKLFTGFWFLIFPQIIFFKFVCISYPQKGIFPLSAFLTKCMLTRNSSPRTFFSARLKWRWPSRWDSCENFSYQLKKFLLSFVFLWTFEVVFERLTSGIAYWASGNKNLYEPIDRQIRPGSVVGSRSKSRQGPRSFVWTKTPDSITIIGNWNLN